jgi:hypothetical protein
LATVTSLALPALGGAIGSDYRIASNRLIFVEFAGNVSQVDMSVVAYSVLGGGYTQPEDVVVSSDETTAYVTERSGNFLQVDLTNANRAAAAVLTGGLNAPHQIALDEDHGHAYVVEFSDPGRLLRIDLTTGTPTTLVPDLHFAIGLVVSANGRYAYVTEQLAGGNGRLSQIDLVTNLRTVLFTSPTAPLFFMSWADPGRSSILVPERDPADDVWVIDLTNSPPTARTLATGVPSRPSSVNATSPDILLLCSDSQISQIDLVGGAFSIGGPIILGVGLVPVSRIEQSAVSPKLGYADTTVDLNYFFQVLDTPFGGTLALMFNHERAWTTLGARYYKIFVDGVLAVQPWSDYLWNTVTNSFDLQTLNPAYGGFFRVRAPGQIWFNHWLGYLLDTTALTGGLHTVRVRVYAHHTNASEINILADPYHSVQLMVDNRGPHTSIDEIDHDGNPVATCAIIDSGTYFFDFKITARDLDGNLKSWSLSAEWGDNKSALIASANYPSVDPPPTWFGPSGAPVGPWDCQIPAGVVPPDTNADSTSWRCAHTFRLGAWDRTINGYGYLYYNEYNKSITILLPPP